MDEGMNVSKKNLHHLKMNNFIILLFQGCINHVCFISCEKLLKREKNLKKISQKLSISLARIILNCFA